MFGKKKKEESKPEEQKPEPIATRVYEYIDLNISDKMMKCQIDEDEEEACIRYGKAKQVGDIMRLTASGIVIADVGKRSKAYTALKSKEGQTSTYVVIRKEEGDYGTYYRVKMKFDTNTVIIK